MRDSVAADSTFYSCCTCDIKRKDILTNFLRAYSFYVGNRILSELPNSLVSDNNFIQSVNVANFDYYELIKPFFGRNPDHINDGEYEAIGIGYMLDMEDRLRFLIIDDRRPYKFVKRHFSHLASRMNGTIGFVQNACCEDRRITPNEALDFLLEIKNALNSSEKTRPCSINPDVCRAILMPAIEYIRNYNVSA